MTDIKEPQPVKYLAGLLFSEAMDPQPVYEALEGLLGPIDLRTEREPFEYTGYYEPEMGRLLRQYVAFEKLDRPDRLAGVKVATNQLEDRWRKEDGGRQVNIDPGYLSQYQLVLASAKSFFHRIYLGQGIHAEVTLYFKDGSFQPLAWSYPDYQDKIPVFNEWKQHYREQLKNRREV